MYRLVVQAAILHRLLAMSSLGLFLADSTQVRHRVSMEGTAQTQSNLLFRAAAVSTSIQIAEENLHRFRATPAGVHGNPTTLQALSVLAVFV